MSDETPHNTGPLDGRPAEPASETTPSRRRVLLLGAATAAGGAVMSIRPALAQSAGSVLNCEIPVPDPGRAGSFIDAEGRVVPSGTKGAYPSSPRPFKGEDVRRAMAGGGNLPGVDNERSRAYVKYIRRLQRGQGGFTCFASLQMPRR